MARLNNSCRTITVQPECGRATRSGESPTFVHVGQDRSGVRSHGYSHKSVNYRSIHLEDDARPVRFTEGQKNTTS